MGRPGHERRVGLGVALLLGRNQVRDAFSNRIGTPTALFLGKLGLTPNSLTVSGLLFSGLGAFLASTGQLWGAGLVLVFSSVFDLFDGALARATGKVTRFGALLDSVVDRVSEAIVLFGLLVYYLSRDETPGVLLTYLALVGSVMVSYLRARSEGLGVDCKVGVMTRTERVAVLGAGLFAGHWVPNLLLAALATIAALSMVTSVHRALHTRSALRDDR